MSSELTRRAFLGVAGSAVAAGAAETGAEDHIKILGVSCSPRKGKTTAAAVNLCLDAAKAVDPRIQTELIELAGMNIGVFDPANPDSQGDFKKLIPILSDAKVAGIIVGTPVYFSGMSSLCKAFLDHCMVFRKNNFTLRNKVAGVAAVGGVRNGGQELAIGSVQAALFCQEMIVVGDGRPSGHTGATLVNNGQDDISGDEFGIGTAKNLGRRVAEVVIRMHGKGQ